MPRAVDCMLLHRYTFSIFFTARCVCVLLVFVQLYPVEEILTRYTKGAISGPALVHKLQAGIIMERSERIFFVKAVCRYLMKSALTLVYHT